MDRIGERSRTVLHLSCLITAPSTMRLEATLPFQGSYDAGSVSIVEPSCIYLANHGPFDVAQGSYDAGPVSAVEPSIFKQKKPDLMRVRL